MFEDFPDHIVSVSNQVIPMAVRERLKYLWKSSTELIATSPDTSHRLSRRFMEQVQKLNIKLPDGFVDKICPLCHIIHVPAVSCQVRLKPRTRNSKLNRHSSSKKFANEIVICCLHCKNTSRKIPGFSRRINKRNAQKARDSASVAPLAAVNVHHDNTEASTYTTVPTVTVPNSDRPGIHNLSTLPKLGEKRKKGFSFLDSSISPPMKKQTTINAVTVTAVVGSRTGIGSKAMITGKANAASHQPSKLSGDFISLNSLGGMFKLK
jgi:RNase P subunit RPR2